MYIPRVNLVEDRTEIIEFISNYNFATIISQDGKNPVGSHIPIEYELKQDDLYLKGHLAKANPQWKTFSSDQNILLVFMEAHTYISSSWYEKPDVPTWNYIAIHMYGKPRVFDGDELFDFVAFQMKKYEAASKKPLQIEQLDPDMLKRELRGIVGFEVKVEDIQAKYKLSQNKQEATFKNIVQELEQRKDEHSHKIAAAMRQIKT